jgi:hypothetical protein
MGELKTVSSRGGAVVFRLPSDWIEEDEGNGRIFFPPYDDSPTLHLDVLTFESPTPLKQNAAVECLRMMDETEKAEIKFLANGLPYLADVLSGEENGQESIAYTWQIACPGPDRLMQVAVFTWSMTAKHHTDPIIQAQTQLAARQVGALTFNK